MALDGRIIEGKEYGEHIELACRNHPEKRWSTKNIGCIGARTIFYNLEGDRNMGQECDCPASCLYPTGD
jgi:hypothetical protein